MTRIRFLPNPFPCVDLFFLFPACVDHSSTAWLELMPVENLGVTPVGVV